MNHYNNALVGFLSLLCNKTYFQILGRTYLKHMKGEACGPFNYVFKHLTTENVFELKSEETDLCERKKTLLMKLELSSYMFVYFYGVYSLQNRIRE